MEGMELEIEKYRDKTINKHTNNLDNNCRNIVSNENDEQSDCRGRTCK